MIHTHTKRSPKGALPSFSDLLSCPLSLFLQVPCQSALPMSPNDKTTAQVSAFSPNKKKPYFSETKKTVSGGGHLTGGPRVSPHTWDSHQETAENSREEGGISKTYRALLKPAASPLCNRRPHSVLCICVALTRMKKHKPTCTWSWTLHFT